MKRKMNLLKDNRGAALVSVMIAVAFIAILGSAILYLSYSNYQMKVVNYQSKVNFYGTESDMTEVSTAIRNEIMAGSNPLQALKDAIGVKTVGGVERYNATYLAALAYPDLVTPDDSLNNIDVSTGDIIAHFDTTIPDGTPNFESVTSGNTTTVTIKGVLIEHRNTQDESVHKITTDLTFKILENNTTTDPGGIGEFSMLMDSPVSIAPGDGKTTRATMYGNVFVGPGTYVYNGSTINPSGADALVLTGESLFTQKGDYMVVFGNVVLEDNAVLSVVSGRLTVYGNIIIRDNAAFLCTGEVYFPNGTNATGAYAGQKYGIYATNTHNVIPASLIDATNPTVQYLEDADYTDMLTTLALNDTNYDNDGILHQILVPEMREKLESPYIEAGSKESSSLLNYYGVNYGIRMHNASTMNDGDANNRLTFNVGTTTMQDGSNLNATVISITPITISNQKNSILSQLGSEVFAALTATSTDEYEDYSEATHQISLKVMDGSEYQNGKKVDAGAFFEDDANDIVNQILNLAGGDTTEPQSIQTAVGYVNWVKE